MSISIMQQLRVDASKKIITEIGLSLSNWCSVANSIFLQPKSVKKKIRNDIFNIHFLVRNNTRFSPSILISSIIYDKGHAKVNAYISHLDQIMPLHVYY